MSLLQVSSTQLTFQPNQSFKTIQLTNLSSFQNVGRPLMYKIKTNKIQLVDAKPSCGYISGLKGQNQINVVIRSLVKKQYDAKIQILYISHEMITSQIVQKNQKHFDINEYNEFYDKIKNVSKNDAKTILLKVVKKAQPPVIPAPIPIAKVEQKIQKIEAKKQQTTDRDSITMKRGKFTNVLVAILIIGMLIGYSIGKYSFKKKNLDNAQQLNQINAIQTEQNVQVAKGSNLAQSNQAPDTQMSQETGEQTQETERQIGEEGQQQTDELYVEQYDQNPIQPVQDQI